MTVGYLTFGRDDLCYGLEVVKREIEASGHKCYRVTPKTARYCDVLIFSVFWWEHIFVLADWLRKAGIDKKQSNRPRLIAGGFCTFNPVPMLQYVDAVVVGDGEDITLPAVNGDYSGKSVLCEGKQVVEWNNSPTLRPICHETNNIARIELSRGCRCRCRFCAVAHLKPYREASIEDIEACLRSTKQKRVALFAPEPTMHSRDDDITMLCRRLGKARQDSDVRLDRLSHRSDSVPRVGIEGLSERLRKSVNKGYSNEKIIEEVREAIKAGRKGIFMYMILDLPGECEDDWLEFRELLTRIGEIPGADKFLLKPSPSVFMPTPHTPMSGDEIHWEREYGNKWESFFGRGDDRDWKVLMAERSRVFSPHMRLLSMMATRGGEEFRKVESTLSKQGYIAISAGRPVVRCKQMMEQFFDKNGLIELYCGKRENGPWNIVKTL